MGASLLTAENCPHLVIGAPSNVNPDDAVAAFARASKRVKSNPDAPFQIEDLTSALATVQATSRSDESGLKYSIPANPDALIKERFFEFGGSKFTAESDLSRIDVSKIEALSKTPAGQVFLGASIHKTLQWDWSTAAEYARNCLRLSEIEEERDEALNVLAAALAAQGDGQRALDALKKAVEGKWNLALQANLALLAVDIDPSLAIEHMSFLVDGAKTFNEKVRAFSTAIDVWQKSQSKETGSDDQDDFEPLPRNFLNSIQSIIASPDISEETFYEYGKFLARVDPIEFQKSDTFKNNQYLNSPSMRLIRAKCTADKEWMNELVPVAVASGDSCPWIQEEVDDFVLMINRELISDEPQNWAVNLAFSFLDKGLDCSNRGRILLRGFTIINLSQVLKEDAQPSDKFIHWLEVAQRTVQNRSDTILDLDEEGKKFAIQILGRAGNVLCVLFGVPIQETMKTVAPHVWQIEKQMSTFFGRMNAPKTEISRISMTIVNFCYNSIATLNRVRALANDTEMIDSVSNLLDALEKMKRTVINYR